MISFLRNFRQKLIAENKFSKYLIYAVGEIVLVVIGILIALGVNNWNQDKKDQRLGKELLIRIQRDLVKDTLNFKSSIDRNNRLRKDLKSLLVNLYDGVDSIEEVQSMSETWDQLLDQAFSPNDNTYQSILSSGSLGLIANQDLKDAIINLYSDYEETKVLLSSISDWMIGLASNMDSQTNFIKFGSTVSDIYTTADMFNEEDFAFLNQKDGPEFKLFVRAISGAAFYQKVNNSYRETLIKKCHILLQAIDKELND